MRLAADSGRGLAAIMPSVPAIKPSWQPSGVLNTVDQLREVVESTRAGVKQNMDVMRPDLVQRTPTIPKRVGRTGPCTFGCTTTSRKDRNGPLWYSVPNPPPLAGLQAGETLCAKCYDWLIANKRRRIGREVLAAPAAPRRGILHGLVRCAHLNGQTVLIEAGPDAEGKFHVKGGGGDTFRVPPGNLRHCPALPAPN